MLGRFPETDDHALIEREILKLMCTFVIFRNSGVWGPFIGLSSAVYTMVPTVVCTTVVCT